MKALIISDKQEIIDLLRAKLVDDGYDIIVYHWLLKALDNVEEIQPDYIVLSADEYPRHWKTLASFVQSGIGGKDVRFCLYNADNLSDDDKSKAEKLNVEFWCEKEEVTSKVVPVETPVVNEITEPANEPAKAVPVVNEITETAKAVPVVNEYPEQALILTHPITKNFVLGTAKKIDENTYECSFNRMGFMLHQNIQYVTVGDDNSQVSFDAEIKSFNKDLINLKVNKYYEI